MWTRVVIATGKVTFTTWGSQTLTGEFSLMHVPGFKYYLYFSMLAVFYI